MMMILVFVTIEGKTAAAPQQQCPSGMVLFNTECANKLQGADYSKPACTYGWGSNAAWTLDECICENTLGANEVEGCDAAVNITPELPSVDTGLLEKNGVCHYRKRLRNYDNRYSDKRYDKENDCLLEHESVCSFVCSKAELQLYDENACCKNKNSTIDPNKITDPKTPGK